MRHLRSGVIGCHPALAPDLARPKFWVAKKCPNDKSSFFIYIHCKQTQLVYVLLPKMIRKKNVCFWNYSLFSNSMLTLLPIFGGNKHEKIGWLYTITFRSTTLSSMLINSEFNSVICSTTFHKVCKDFVCINKIKILRIGIEKSRGGCCKMQFQCSVGLSLFLFFDDTSRTSKYSAIEKNRIEFVKMQPFCLKVFGVNSQGRREKWSCMENRILFVFISAKGVQWTLPIPTPCWNYVENGCWNCSESKVWKYFDKKKKQ